MPGGIRVLSMRGFSLKVRSLIFWGSVALFLLPVSILVGWREPSVGTDTKNYIDIFYYSLSDYFEGVEPGYYFLNYIVGCLFERHEYLFLLVFYVVAFSMIKAFVLLSEREKKDQADILFFLGLMLVSSWFYVAVLNGLRQGVSLSILYLSLACLLRGRFVFFAIFLLASISFHYSTFLVLPFLVLLFFRVHYIFAVYLILAVGYFSGVNELLIYWLSSLIGFDAYTKIKSYGLESGAWVGFQLDLFVYTLFWGGLAYFLFVFFGRHNYFYPIKLILKLYLVLCLPYFCFGFGGYSNRYAFMAWLFIPFVQAGLLASMKSDYLKLAISFLFLMFAVGNFVYVFV